MTKNRQWTAGVVLKLAALLSMLAGMPVSSGRDVVFAQTGGQSAAAGAETSRKEIEEFNQKFIAAHLRMDNAAIVSMWAEDGVSLLPETEPIVGKTMIAKFMDDVVARMPGYHMRKIEIDFQGLETNGNWASEWAYEHQIVDGPEGKPPFEGYGKMLLVLRREGDGKWRIEREMWNQGLKR